MKWSLFLLFCIVVAILALFKNYDGFKGGRGFRMSGGGGHHGPFTIVDAVAIVLVLFFLYNDR
jgi:uncharacterized membrane protein